MAFRPPSPGRAHLCRPLKSMGGDPYPASGRCPSAGTNTPRFTIADLNWSESGGYRRARLSLAAGSSARWASRVTGTWPGLVIGGLVAMMRAPARFASLGEGRLTVVCHRHQPASRRHLGLPRRPCDSGPRRLVANTPRGATWRRPWWPRWPPTAPPERAAHPPEVAESTPATSPMPSEPGVIVLLNLSARPAGTGSARST